MGNLKYLDKKGTFTLNNPDLTSYMYFPLANEAGVMSSITPDLGGDIKLDQNTFLLEPVSSGKPAQQQVSKKLLDLR